jgi:hypothetical protein
MHQLIRYPTSIVLNKVRMIQQNIRRLLNPNQEDVVSSSYIRKSLRNLRLSRE